MRKRFQKLTNRTGASGGMSELDEKILKVMRRDKDLLGDTVGSSSMPEGVEVRGKIAHFFEHMQISNNHFHCIIKYA